MVQWFSTMNTIENFSDRKRRLSVALAKHGRCFARKLSNEFSMIRKIADSSTLAFSQVQFDDVR